MTVAFGLYAAAGLAAALGASKLRRLSSRSTVLLSLGGGLVHLGFIVLRAQAAGFLPFASRFESMVLFSLAVQAAGLALFAVRRAGVVKSVTDGISALLLGVALWVFGYVPGGDLNPILNSPWFAFHISVAFAGYGVLTAGLSWAAAGSFAAGRPDDMPRRLAAMAALLLGTGILTGAMWADTSWGRYWSWDPKESWALLTWLVLVVYIHVARGRAHRWPALAFFGLATLTMLFTFIGINLLKWGAHRY